MKYTNFHRRKLVISEPVFLRLLLCDVIKFRDDHARMRINDPLASIARASGRRTVCVVHVLPVYLKLTYI